MSFHVYINGNYANVIIIYDYYGIYFDFFHTGFVNPYSIDTLTDLNG